MPRPRKDLERVKDLILEQRREGLSIDTICAHLRDDWHVLDVRTLKRRLAEWGAQEYSPLHSKIDTNAFVELIKGYFYRYGYSDTSIVRDLKRRGIEISERTVQEYRLKHGMKRRFRDLAERQEAIQKAREFLFQDDRQGVSIPLRPHPCRRPCRPEYLISRVPNEPRVEKAGRTKTPC